MSKAAARVAMSPNLAGALLMMASTACLIINDTFVKATGGTVPLAQLLVIRSLIAGALIFALAWWRGALRWGGARKDWALVALRSMAEVGAAFFFVSALLNMPLANVTAIIQIVPLTVSLGAALVFRERIGWRRMLAILIGFCGMLLIVRPGPEGFSIWSIYALCAVLCVTCRDLATRRISAAVPSMMITLSACISVLLMAAAASTRAPWEPVSGDAALLITGSAVMIVGGYFFSVQVMRHGDVSFIAPFRYTGLLWALLLGWLVFGHWPAPLTVIGAALIVATGLFTLYRERALLRG